MAARYNLTKEKEQKMCESLSKENEIVAVHFPLENTLIYCAMLAALIHVKIMGKAETKKKNVLLFVALAENWRMFFLWLIILR